MGVPASVEQPRDGDAYGSLTGAVEPSLHAAGEAYGPVGRSAWLDVDWTEHQRWVTVGGRPINLVDIGSGPPVVLIHGLGGNWQSWLENIPALAQRHRVIALDLPGFGHSPMPVEPISISGYGRCIDALLDELGIASAALVGNSMGGFVAAEVAVSLAARADRLVLVAAAVLWNERRRARPLVTLEKVTRGYGAWLFGRWELAHRRPRLRGFALSSAGIRHPLRLPPELAWEIMCGTGAPGFSDGLATLFAYRLRPRLAEIDCPTLVVWGRNDPLVPVSHAADYQRLIPDSRSVIYEDTGHLPMLERPARFNAEVLRFLGDDAGDLPAGPRGQTRTR